MKVKVSSVIEVSSKKPDVDLTPFDRRCEEIVGGVREAVEVAISRHGLPGFAHKHNYKLSLEVKLVEAQPMPEPRPRRSRRDRGIPARFSTGDDVARAEFDAAPWFQQASVKEIVRLAADGWSCSYSADEVAAWFDGKDVGVTAVYRYIGATQDLPGEVDCDGSSFRVEEEDVLNWLRKQRPEVAARLEERRKP